MARVKIFVAFLLVAFATAKVSYEGHQVWRLHSPSQEASVILEAILTKFNIDLWAVNNKFVDIRVSPLYQEVLKIALDSLEIEYEVMINNMQTLINQEGKNKDSTSRAFDFTVYHPFSEIEEYLTQIDANYSMASLSSIGQTYEGRDQWQLTISTGAGKPAIWIDCGIHAREWITPATCLYGIDYLLNWYGVDADVTNVLDNYDLFILSVYNPDGYDHTWVEDRMWRKNRFPGTSCVGVDLNRNFDDHWGVVGSSDVECSSTYHGTSPASEMETQNSQDKILDLVANNDLAMIFTIHSYSQYWMYAYGWTGDLPAEVDILDGTSAVGVAALTAVHGTPYTYGTVYNVLYPAAGTTVDYGYGQAGVIHSYLLELRDTGEYGFLLPEEQIIPTAEETWAGLLAAIQYI